MSGVIVEREPVRMASGKVLTLGYRVTFGTHRPEVSRPGFGTALHAMAQTERARRESVAK